MIELLGCVIRRIARAFRPPSDVRRVLYASAEHVDADDFDGVRCRSLEGAAFGETGVDWGGGLCFPMRNGVLVQIDEAPRCLRRRQRGPCGFSAAPDAPLQLARTTRKNLFRLWLRNVRVVVFTRNSPYVPGLSIAKER